jgi:prepilin-type N-terminal cleavage/methylation domain-containing protein
MNIQVLSSGEEGRIPSGPIRHSNLFGKFSVHPGGFTLIELTMVILLIGFMLSITLPRLQNIALSDSLKNTVRIMTAQINELRYQAIKNNQEYFLIFNFDTQKFSTDSPSLTTEERTIAQKGSITLPPDVSVLDIEVKGSEMISSKEISIRITKEGYIDPGVIHLGSKDGRRFTFVLRAFLGSVSVLENYVKIEDVKL